MTQRLIGLPLQLGIRAARLGLRAARLPLDVIGVTGRGPEAGGEAQPEGPPPSFAMATPAAEAPAPPEPAPPVPEPAPAPPAAANGGAPEVEEVPAHVSEEAELVAEFAEAGAEEGAHAEVDVAEPWEGYKRMTARDVEQRLATATAEEIAVVQLYESMHKRRESVLRATERRMKQQAAERRRPR